jgi:hypothetical protein
MDKNMSAVFVQVKNYNRSPLCGAEYDTAVDGLHRSIQAACGESQPCMAIIMQVGSQAISAKTNKGVYRDCVFVRDNVLYVIKPAMDTLRYPYATDQIIGMLRGAATLMSNKGTVNSALKARFKSNAYSNGLDPIGFDG